MVSLRILRLLLIIGVTTLTQLSEDDYASLEGESYTSAGVYDCPGDLAVITCHFNPLHYKTRLRNFDVFLRPFHGSGIPLYVVEQTTEGSLFEIAAPDVMRIRGGNIMWQKERLLNLLINKIPKRYSKIVWIDADILFTNSRWAVDTSRLLDDYAVVQPFESAVRLPPDTQEYHDSGDWYKSFGAVYQEDPQACSIGCYEHHGHTGFAWAARRDALPLGLYDRCISGSGDHVMAHAFVGDWDSECMFRTFGRAGAMIEDYWDWSRRTYRAVKARLSYVGGTALHLWHGDMVNRQYSERNTDLIKMNFDPRRDLTLDTTGCWRWSRFSQQYESWSLRYFSTRREDDYDTIEQRSGHGPAF